MPRVLSHAGPRERPSAATHPAPPAEFDWMTSLGLATSPRPAPPPRLPPDRLDRPVAHVSSTLILGPRSRSIAAQGSAKSTEPAPEPNSSAAPPTIQAGIASSSATPVADRAPERAPSAFNGAGHVHGPGCRGGCGHRHHAATAPPTVPASTDAPESTHAHEKAPAKTTPHAPATKKPAPENAPSACDHAHAPGSACGHDHASSAACDRTVAAKSPCGHAHAPGESCGHAHGAGDATKVKPFLERLADHSLVRMLQATTGILMIPLTPLMVYALVKSVEPLKACLPNADAAGV